MKRFWGVVKYEYGMSIRRWGLWLAFGLIFLPYLFSLSVNEPGSGPTMAVGAMRQSAGTLALQLNLLMPVVGGVVLADRLARDFRLGVSELLNSTALSRWAYLLGKYVGTLGSVLTPVLLAVIIISGFGLIYGSPLQVVGFLGWALLGFLTINVPAYAFITAFSLACPLIMPVRVYQVLFIGYWFWGNFLNPMVFPTLNGTVLTPAGHFALQRFFGTEIGSHGLYSGDLALLNLGVLALCVVLVMAATERFLAWKAQRA